MQERQARQSRIREPIRTPWIWVAIVLLIVGGSPLFWPTGTVEPLLFGIPSWILVSAACTALFALTVSWACLRCWNIEEPEEERARLQHGGRPAAPKAHESGPESPNSHGG
ncbi:hypothetical protein [Allosalinactinospora lopnorensis]|uniref:hypothetical protein n=1 Tax=Allosalinactinospora lopnorensis TaxID=1352348 RepID=UPI000623FF3B|nr:hypothetical protein [Allosalinactinospora lopnorensis]